MQQTRTGKGNALACGFAACTGDIIVMIDADGSTDPAEIPLFVDALIAGADFVKGSRFAEGGDSHDITRAAQARQRRAQPGRQRALRDPVHRPLLRLQRVLAPRRADAAAARHHAAAPDRRRQAVGRRLRDRDDDQHPGRGRRHDRSARSPASSTRASTARATSTRSATASGCCARSSASTAGCAASAGSPAAARTSSCTSDRAPSTADLIEVVNRNTPAASAHPTDVRPHLNHLNRAVRRDDAATRRLQTAVEDDPTPPLPRSRSRSTPRSWTCGCPYAAFQAVRANHNSKIAGTALHDRVERRPRGELRVPATSRPAVSIVIPTYRDDRWALAHPFRRRRPLADVPGRRDRRRGRPQPRRCTGAPAGTCPASPSWRTCTSRASRATATPARSTPTRR